MQAKLSLLISILRAAVFTHHHAHLTVSGPSFIGDHELFSELYTPLTSEADSLSERGVFLYGAATIDPVAQAQMSAQLVAGWSKQRDLFLRAAAVEATIQQAIADCIVELDDASIGLDDQLRSLANDHLGRQYKLGQRIG